MGQKTVLLVEDDAEIRDLLQDILEHEGYDVIPAGSGKQALDYLSDPAQARPDAIVLDLMMPIVTGWQVLDQLRADEELCAIPVVVVTAVDRDRPTGISALFKKPIDLQGLLDALKSFIRTPRTQLA